jgi:hypothetical protein
VKEYTVSYHKTNAGVVVMLRIKDEFLQVHSLFLLSFFPLPHLFLLVQIFANIDSDPVTFVQPVRDNPVFAMFEEYSNAGQAAWILRRREDIADRWNNDE